MTVSGSEKSATRTGEEPLVSVVIPAYNSSRFIAATVESVLNQTLSSFEVIIVNDGSPDTNELEAALRPYSSRVRYLRQENRGPSAARNVAIQKAIGRYVAFVRKRIGHDRVIHQNRRARVRRNQPQGSAGKNGSFGEISHLKSKTTDLLAV